MNELAQQFKCDMDSDLCALVSTMFFRELIVLYCIYKQLLNSKLTGFSIIVAFLIHATL
jgi:hypothetical protein